MAYRCPGCRTELAVERAYDGRISVSCPSCGVQGLIAASSSDEAVLEFACRHDAGSLAAGSAGPDEAMVRPRAEIDAMVDGAPLGELARSIIYSQSDYISHYERMSRPEPEMGKAVSELGLHPGLAAGLESAGISRLYAFQQEALERMAAGQDIAIEAPTASGKTEAFLIPIIDGLARSGGTALIAYPTKALARDQLAKISGLAGPAGLRAAAFDGDTGASERREMLAAPPDILATNFDMLHYHMMTRSQFVPVISAARYLAIDEAHTYSGIFGSNVHHIIRRLRRLARNSIQIAAASATLNDAGRFCTDLFGSEAHVVSGSGSSSETDFVMAFPSLRTQRALMIDVLKKLQHAGLRAMAFSNSHRAAEMLAVQAQKQGVGIKVHRAGLMPGYRRSVEDAFRSGRLRAVSCTPTLELGMDIGGVDGVVSAAVPVNRLMQRIGRAGRRGRRSCAVLALGNDPISQYYRNHPQDYFEDSEKAYIDPANPFVAQSQALAMACDAPLSEREAAAYPEAVSAGIDAGLLIRSGNMIAPSRRALPAAKKNSIRGMGGEIGIFLGGRQVGSRSLPVALEELHKDAVYFLAGVRYRVVRNAYPRSPLAEIERLPKSHSHYTRALTEEWPSITDVHESRAAFGTEAAFCSLQIRKIVYGYASMEIGAEAGQGQRVSLEEPMEYVFGTKGLVLHAPQPADAMAGADDSEYAEASAYHATEHLLIEGSNMITGGASRDMGGISMGTSGVIFIHDGAIGGSGASRALYERLEAAVLRGLAVVSECPCSGEPGCPRCTFSYRCGNNNEYLHKAGAAEVLRRVSSGQESPLEEPAGTDRPIV